MANIYGWDPNTAANNDDIDGEINWLEGQMPGTVNDSARAVMMRVAQFINDTAGNLITGGSGNAYTLTTKSGNTAYTAPLILAFQANRTCTGAPTLAVDGLSALPLFAANGAALVAGSIVSSGVYLATYKADYSGFVVLNIPQAPPKITAYTTAGSYSWTVPNGVFFVKSRVWGGGGGGGGVGSGGGGGAGGAGGGYSEKICRVTPGDVISITVGAGGTAGTGAPTAGGTGGTSAFGSFNSATGGAGGNGGAAGSVASYSSPGGSGSNGDINITGAPGAGGLSAGGSTFGGSGGGAFSTPQSPALSNSTGVGASSPGGGGGGGGGGTFAAGNAGAPGRVIIEY